MIKLFCDRCGKEIVATSKWFLCHETKYHSFNLFHDDVTKDSVRIMLCDPCAEKLMRWCKQLKGVR